MPEVILLKHGKCGGAECSVNTFGATVVSWKVDGAENIFVSSLAKTDGTKAIRGGVPVCFPQFGPWEFGPQHGFARDSAKWKVEGEGGASVDAATGDASVALSLSDDDSTRSKWDHGFKFVYRVTLKARALVLDVEIANTGDTDWDFTLALHTYFRVPDATSAVIRGLKGLTFVDKTDGMKEKVEEREEVRIAGFTDRLYQSAPDEVTLGGLEGGRCLKLTKSNMRDFVVWNPWEENAAKMSDFGDDEFPRMVCVEAAQASERVKIAKGAKFAASHTIAVMD